jgi:RNA polymerase sporulation-specific sigma factor
MQKTFEKSDEELSVLAASGDREAEDSLVARYNRLVRVCARPYFLAGGDSEDLIQEGMLGLIKAVREYDVTKEASFRTFAEICIRSRIYSVLRAESLDKRAALNNSVPLEAPSFDRNSYSFGAFDMSRSDPESILIGRESVDELLNSVQKQLSELEARILGFYLKGLSYQEIAAKVNKSPKSVDNAVQRVRRKVAQQINPSDVSKS